MVRTRSRALAIAAGAVSLGLAATSLTACGSSGTSSGGGGTSASFNAALTGIVNMSDAKGGTLTYVNASDWDSPDPGNTYDAFSWNFDRNYVRTMLSYKQQAGSTGLQVQGDLATGPGSVSSDGLTWTYHIQPDATYQDGSKITTADVKYAIERSNWGQDTLSLGPAYFKSVVQDATSYKGPFRDNNPNDGVSGIVTPDPTTIVFHLTHKFADFDYLMAMMDTAPVPRAKDTGATYYQNIVASGAYEIQSYTPGKEMILVPNPHFVAASDPNSVHKVRANEIVVKVKVAQTTVDQDLLNNQAQIDMGGVGVTQATQSRILNNANLKKNADDALTGFVDNLSINTTIKPFDNIDCRKAIAWAIDKAQVQSVFGGTIGGGDIATTVLPPTNTGYVANDQYATPGGAGDISKAKSEIAKCQAAEPASFSGGHVSVELGTFSPDEQPKNQAAAAVIVNDLSQIGVSVTPEYFPFGTFFADYGGNPTYVKAHNMVLTLTAWGADFPTGFGYMYSLLTKAGIQPGGGSTNLSYWDSPTFDAYISQALSTTDPSARNAIYAKADQYAMSQSVIVPLLYAKSLFYRAPSATNVTITQAYGMYDYSIIGVK
jgi:peptide/nickel transport system substrate-binding protein